MNGFYSIWTKPFFQQKNRDDFFMQDFELLTLLLSAEEWKLHNGPVKMVADEQAISFLEEMDLLPVFNAGVEKMVVDDRINPKVFWAAGKLKALELMNEPSVMIDLDLIVWENLDKFFENQEICVIHKEPIRGEIYPGKDFFHMDQEYQFDASLNWSVQPANTALLYIKDRKLKSDYVKAAEEFMIHSTERDDNLCHMVFAEQRLISMYAQKAGKGITTFVDDMGELDCQQTFTHVWGHKNVLRFEYDKREEYCKKCLARLKKDAPAAYKIAAKWDEIRDYL